MKSAKQIYSPDQQIICGLFSKKDAATYLAKGSRHVHSSVLGAADPQAKLSESALSKKDLAHYPWEQGVELCSCQLSSSKHRRELIDTITKALEIHEKRSMREKVNMVLEELITNGIYHAYINSTGSEKYQRKDAVELKSSESLSIQYGATNEGIYLSVTDKGGGVSFEKLSKVFNRCYEGSPDSQIETKDSGAGLGFYMIFEAVTHLKIFSQHGKGTTVSCWIANKANFDPDHFSFNYFEEGVSK